MPVGRRLTVDPELVVATSVDIPTDASRTDGLIVPRRLARAIGMAGPVTTRVRVRRRRRAPPRNWRQRRRRWFRWMAAAAGAALTLGRHGATGHRARISARRCSPYWGSCCRAKAGGASSGQRRRRYVKGAHHVHRRPVAIAIRTIDVAAARYIGNGAVPGVVAPAVARVIARATGVGVVHRSPLLGLSSPAVEDGQIKAAIQNNFLTTGARRLQGPTGIIQPNIHALDEMASHIDVVVLNEDELVGKFACGASAWQSAATFSCRVRRADAPCRRK